MDKGFKITNVELTLVDSGDLAHVLNADLVSVLECGVDLVDEESVWSRE